MDRVTVRQELPVAGAGTVRPCRPVAEAGRAAITASLDAAGSSRGRTLVVRGVAGSGRSTLRADAVGAAAGMTVLRSRGVESASPLAFVAPDRAAGRQPPPGSSQVEALLVELLRQQSGIEQ